MATNPGYVTLTDENFRQEVLQSEKPVLVDFWAAWCGPCRVLGPVIEQLASELDGAAKVGKLNVDENPATAQQFGIRSIPTVLFFDKGQRVDSIIGVVPKDTLRSKLAALAAPV